MMTITAMTSAARPRLAADAKVPSCFASNPPPTLVMPTLTRVSPISVTTIPITNGVMIRLAERMNGPNTSGTNAVTRHTPNTAPSACSRDPPSAMIAPASETMGATNTKLVP